MTSRTTRRIAGSLTAAAVLASTATGVASAAPRQADGSPGGRPAASGARTEKAPARSTTARPAARAARHAPTTTRTTTRHTRPVATSTGARNLGTVSGTTASGTTTTSSSPSSAAATSSSVTLSSTTSISTAGLSANAIKVLRAANATFPQVTSIGGLRSGSGAQDHGTGHALDLMTWDKATGDRIAAYMQQHASELGITYMIWRQHIWSVQRADEGWRLMADRGSATANHYYHVHVSVG